MSFVSGDIPSSHRHEVFEDSPQPLSRESSFMNDISSTTPHKTMRQRRPLHTGRPDRCDCVALVLQGGGALGAYQAGVYQAMHEANILPDWVSGVSIGAINAAIIAGNPPHRRLAQLHAFWNLIDRKSTRLNSSH